jgi:hypothetical protein
MDDTTIDHGSNISGIGLLLNVEKISNSVDIDDMERKVKNMYIDAPEESEEEQEEDQDLLEEYEQAMEDIQSTMAAEDENDYDDGDDADDAISVVSRRSRFIQDSNDIYYMQKTRDDHLQTSISRVMEHVPKMNIDMEQEIEEERKNTLLEQIEALRDDLAERIEEVHRRLTFKYNKLKYNSIAEEALVAGASLLEMIFNGRNSYFGTKPDITGYSDVVKSKLKRIRVETSTAVSKFVAKHDVGVVPRLMMELLPSLITQSQRRKLQAGDSLNASVSYKKSSIRSHISDLNNM